jgi:hypothetical protein
MITVTVQLTCDHCQSRFQWIRLPRKWHQTEAEVTELRSQAHAAGWRVLPIPDGEPGQLGEYCPGCQSRFAQSLRSPEAAAVEAGRASWLPPQGTLIV